MTKFADLRALEKELEEIDSKLQKNPSFHKAINLIEELENAKNSLADSKEKIPKLGLEIQQSIEAIKEEKHTLLQTLD